MKRYYLDTVTVRRLSKELVSLAGSCYTSAFSVLELLSGVSEKEYGARKAALKSLFRSGIEIDWRLPMKVVMESFQLQERADSISGDDIKKVAEALIDSVDYKDFIYRNKALQPDINLLTFFDNRLSAEFANTFLTKTAEIRKSRSKDKGTKFNAKKEKGVNAMADFICQKLLPPNTGRPEDVAKKYNGSVDHFILAWLGYYDINANLLNSPSTNDWADILHTTYLGNGTDFIFVSDDKKIRKLLNKLAPGSSISVEEFVAGKPNA